MDTPRGIYRFQGKVRNAVLRGPGYAQPVSYWMPFWNGYGLHDASWRSNFGGSIYTYNGSHGCVNIPPWRAGEFYDIVRAGTVIYIY